MSTTPTHPRPLGVLPTIPTFLEVKNNEHLTQKTYINTSLITDITEGSKGVMVSVGGKNFSLADTAYNQNILGKLINITA